MTKVSPRAGKKLATNLLKNPGGALDITASMATAAAPRNPKAAVESLPEVINFCHTEKKALL